MCLWGCSCIFCWSQDNEFHKNLSPKLNEFLTSHPVASQELSSAISEAFGSRRLQISYFYSEDEAIPKAAHTYPDSSSVSIRIRENQLPCDEYICLLFEVLNSKGEQHFQQLFGMAKAGTISKTDFATGMLKQEFETLKKTRGLIAPMGLNQKEISESYYYNRFIQCPDDFDKFLSYRLKVSSNRDAMKEYEQLYDALAKESQEPKSK